MKRAILLWIAIATVMIAAVAAFAHDTWLVADAPSVRAGQPLALHLTSGMSFPKFETGPDPSRVARAGWRLGSQHGDITSFEKGDSAMVVHGRPMSEGVGVVWMDLAPKDIDLDAREVEHYLDEIGASESVRNAWEKAGPNSTWHETYTKHAKTFVRVGDAVADRTCLEPTGMSLEFLPDRDPTSLAAGDTLAVKVVKKGNEMESFAVGVVCGANGSSTLLRTNKAGYVRIPIHHTGWWLVRGTELRRQSDGTWESDFSTMTFHAGGKR